MNDEVFAQCVEEGITLLPEWVREKLVNVVFLIMDEPTVHEREENGLGADETLFGLYEGVPLALRGDEAVIMPDRIIIFKNPIRETYKNDEDIRVCIQNTIWHEVAHYFGYDEEWVEAEELKRGKIP